MLKSCFQCIAGERIDNEMSGTLNGLSQKDTWPQQRGDNEIIFQLPRSLGLRDSIVIKGQLASNTERLRIGLMRRTGEYLYYINFDFVRDEIIIGKNNEVSEIIPELSKILDADFTFYMKFKDIMSESGFALATMLGGNGFTDIYYDNDLLEGDKYLTVHDDTLKLEQLQFVWGT